MCVTVVVWRCDLASQRQKQFNGAYNISLEGAQTTHLIATETYMIFMRLKEINNPIYNTLHLFYVSAMLPVHYTVIERSQRHLVQVA